VLSVAKLRAGLKSGPKSPLRLHLAPNLEQAWWFGTSSMVETSAGT
jgi:hypothetical protein